jgi:ABC-type glycerol-3-phosphate transport system substrate-binding protein
LESDFPPENYEQLIQVAKQLQEEGPGKFGMQVHGSQGDVTDEITVVWTVAEGGHEGNYINEDWTDVNYDNQIWIDAFEKNVEIYREHELSDEGTPTSSDERATRLMMSGDVSMSQINAQNFAMFLNEAPDLIENGDIRFGRAWEGDAGYAGTGFIATFALCNPPSDADEQDWETAQQGAIQFIESFLGADWQTEWAELFGHVPAREDVWEDIAEQMTNEEEVRFGESIISTADKMGPAWPSHPELAFVKAQAPGPEFQKALRGELTTEEALNNAAQIVRDQTSLGN